MPVRTTETTVTFTQSFFLAPTRDTPHAPGIYLLEVDEELVEGVSFIIYQRTATRIHTPATTVLDSPLRQTLTISHQDLEAALAADRVPEPRPKKTKHRHT